MLQEIDFEHLDPGIAYFSVDYAVVFATQRPLYSQQAELDRSDARHGRRGAGSQQ